MKELGNPPAQRHVFFLGANALNREFNAIYFKVENPTLVVGEPRVVLMTVENLGENAMDVALESSVTTEDPSFEPFQTNYGSAFAQSFGNEFTVNVAGTGRRDGAANLDSTIRYYRIVSVPSVAGFTSPVKVTLTSTNSLAILA